MLSETDSMLSEAESSGEMSDYVIDNYVETRKLKLIKLEDQKAFAFSAVA